MDTGNINLTTAEWSIMECLWEKSPRTGREAVKWLEEHMDWNRSTTLTLIRRLEAKGAIASGTERGIKVFWPLIRREEAALQETEELLEKAYRGSLSLLVSSLTKKQSLPQEEIDELYAILRQAEEENRD